jgi:1,4-alpha-glucan branching enzyme
MATSAPRKPVSKKTAKPTTKALKSAKTTLFLFDAAKQSEVQLAGSFNEWQPVSMVAEKLRGKGKYRYSLSLDLPAGDYEYKLVVDGNWITDPECEEAVPNQFGSLNSVLHVD